MYRENVPGDDAIFTREGVTPLDQKQFAAFGHGFSKEPCKQASILQEGRQARQSEKVLTI